MRSITFGWVTQRLSIRVLSIGAGLAILLAASGSALAQTPPASNQGPRFEQTRSPSGPQRVPLLCTLELGGIWEVQGQQLHPTANTYSGTVRIEQFLANRLFIEQLGTDLTYWGECGADSIRLDAYYQGTFIGYQDASIRTSPARLEAMWMLFVPDFASGRETWRRS